VKKVSINDQLGCKAMKISAPVSIRKCSCDRRPVLRCTGVEKAVSVSDQNKALLALADKYEAKIRRKLLEAINSLRSGVKIRELANLIERGASDTEVFAALGLDKTLAHMGSTLDEIHSAVYEGGTLTVAQAAEGISGLPKMEAYFDRASPDVVEYLRDRSSDLVTRITDDVRTNIRTTLADMVAGGEGTPMTAARRLRDSIGLTERQQQAVQNYRRYLEMGDSRAYARNIGRNAERIINAGFRDNTMSVSKIDSLVESYTNRLLQSRAQQVAQTEAFRAANTGAHQGWSQIAEQVGIDKGELRRFWVDTNDAHTRDAHRAIPDMNPDGVGLDEPFDSPLGPIMYPGDPDADPANSINCRCRIVVRFTNTPKGFLPPMIAGRTNLGGTSD
jgi:hypothetical protein